ncbi:sugar phosphate nucleotidyltransferase [[Eubacterium] cellulosolvens]
MKGVVLAGGFGVRLKPLTEVTNKHLLPIFDEPMIFKVIKTLTNSGITDILIVLGGESVGDFVKLLGSGKNFGAKFTYVYQDGAGGIAEALSLAEDFVGNQDMAVILGDNIFEDKFSEHVKAFSEEDAVECYLFLKKVPDPERFGIAEVGENNKVINIEEKPKQPKSNLAVTGLYFYKANVFDLIREVVETIGYSDRNELEITDVNNLYVKRNSAKAFNVAGFWSDAGKFETLLKASAFIASKKDSS